MTTNEAEIDGGSSSIREPYLHDDESTMTLRQHASRTAEKQARWLLPYLHPGLSLLDCGCASGSITVGLAESVAPGHVTGVDISEVEIGRAEVRAKQENVRNVSFAVGNVYELDFSDNSFDVLFSHNVLEHLAEPIRAVQEMQRVLKPGGVIGLRDFDMGGMLLAPDTEILQRFVSIYEADWEQLNGHPRLGRQLVGLMTQAGFADIVATASYDPYSGFEGRNLAAELAVGRLSEEAFVERIIAHGMATQDDISAMIDAWLAWRELPSAFFALAHVEVVGRKP